MIEAKPPPTDAILTDAKTADRYNAAIELWGERLWRAGARICRAVVADGMALPFTCPAPAAQPAQP
ncbi:MULTISPECIES: hypothetical protein [unclassified Sphingomonas]|uniref:hypothetical protein n=1 Tax=unclassified Sphingomonas TaxID=196159 RepID=UPI00092841ED|nr:MULTISPECIES: hypothetical protein [unclassified Sphingomonas]MBN8848142.1 hypothetical protein [Sphingomonas sp.]OJV30639.1 MAG: hypothetical protein BGO24_07960 [Sphingomonas sp. 67-36]